MKKSNFQTVIFAIIYVPMTGHTSKILNGDQTKGKGEISVS